MKILIIDDEEFFIENLAQYLKKKISAEISYVSRSEEALHLLEKERFDLVVCDLNLTDQSEGELVLSINKINSQQRFIIISAISEKEMPKRLMDNKNLDIVAYFEKPFNMESIEDRIKILTTKEHKSSIKA